MRRRHHPGGPRAGLRWIEAAHLVAIRGGQFRFVHPENGIEVVCDPDCYVHKNPTRDNREGQKAIAEAERARRAIRGPR